MTIQELNHALGNLDLFLLDQILKGRFENAERILDVGCGEGRNLTYFIKNDYEVWGIDSNPKALQMLCMVGRSLHKNFDPEKFIEADTSHIPFPPQSFDAIICLAVLHFSSSEEAFFTALAEMMKVLRKDGFLFISMYSNMQGAAKVQDDYFLLTNALYNTLLQKYQLEEAELLKTLKTGNMEISYLFLKRSS